MTIPFLKGWGSSIKDAAEEVTPALKSLVNQNWQQHEALGRELLDPMKLQKYADMYWSNKDAFSEQDIGKKNLARIQATAQDPGFVAQRLKSQAAVDWMKNPDNQAEAQRIATGAEDPVVKQQRLQQLEITSRQNAEQAARVEYFNSLPEEVRNRLRKDQTYLEKIGMTSDALEMADAELARARTLNEDLSNASKWAEQNVDVFKTPRAVANAIENGTLGGVTLGALMLDKKYGGIIKLGLSELENEQRAELQQRGIDAAANKQERSIDAADKRAEAKASDAMQNRVRVLEGQIFADLLNLEKQREAGTISRMQLESSLLPALNAKAQELSSIRGTNPPTITFDDGGYLGRSRIVFTNGDKPVELTASNAKDFLEPKTPASPNDPPKAPPAGLTDLDMDFLERYKKYSLPGQNQSWQSPLLRPVLEKAVKAGLIESLDQPEQ